MEERFEIESKYNVIRGLIEYPETDLRSPAILLSHGLYSSKDSEKYVRLSNVLSREGFVAIRFDYHGSGESGGDISETNLTIRLDNLRATYDYIVQKERIDPERIGILGSSLGGTLAIIFSSMKKTIRALVILATPYAIKEREKRDISEPELNRQFFIDFSKYNVLESASRIKCTLVIHGERDQVVEPSHAFKIFNSLLPPKRLEILKDGDHTISDPKLRENVVMSALSWFKKYL